MNDMLAVVADDVELLVSMSDEITGSALREKDLGRLGPLGSKGPWKNAMQKYQ